MNSTSPWRELREDADEVGALGQGRAAGDVDLRADFVGDDVGEGGLAEARRAVEQDVLDRLLAARGGVDGDLELADQGGLADVLVEALGAEGVVEAVFFFAVGFAGDDAFAGHRGEGSFS